LFLNDIAEVIYAPRKAFKRIVANPKYLGIIIIFLLFLGLQLGYEYSQSSKVQYEVTSPDSRVGAIQNFNNATYPVTLGSNITNWQGGPNVALTNNFDDYFNNTIGVITQSGVVYYQLFGNFSMQAQANNTNAMVLALTNTSNVDCTANGFQNLSIAINLVSPASAPSNATLTLYSLNDNNYYTYDLTSMLSAANAVNQWGNLTVPLGPTASGWTATGNPTWQNITSLTMQLNYPNSENITVRIGALFFRGQFIQPLAVNSLNFVYLFVLQFTLQFLATWLIVAIVIYALFKALKAQIQWKPIFVAAGFALVVMVIRAIVNIAATATLPSLYFPYDAAFAVSYDTFGALYYPSQLALPVASSAAAMSNIAASMAAFRTILTAMFIVSYVWLGALLGIAVKEMKPEFSTTKCLMIAALSVAVTIIVLWLFIGFV
jgi:hypothetical protein